jgi:hypothetical protein
VFGGGEGDGGEKAEAERCAACGKRGYVVFSDVVGGGDGDGVVDLSRCLEEELVTPSLRVFRKVVS